MRSPVIELEEIHLTLAAGGGEVNILNGVNLTVFEQETLAVVGPSGSGKTTTLMIMSGLERPTSGRVAVAGTVLNALSEDDLARFRREHMGIVFQSFHLVPTMTALENVALPLEFARNPAARDAADAALAAVGLSGRAAHYPAQLSGGEQQRVALARAFAGHPRVILADEPTGNLDQDTGGRVMDTLFGLSRTFGTTLVLITHDPKLADRCERSVRMASGTVLAMEAS
jgi:putative ABC transport system ATP-binding protein